MKKNKKILAVLGVLILLLSITTTSAFAMSQSGVKDEEMDWDVLSFNVKQNTAMMDTLFENTKQEYYDNDSSLQVIIDNEMKAIAITLDYKDARFCGLLNGSSELISTEEEYGFVGVYEGSFDSINEFDVELNELGKIPVIADITFNDSEIFICLTIGYPTEEKAPVLLFYGDWTPRIRIITTENGRRLMQTQEECSYGYDDDTMPLRIDGELRYQGYTNAHMGSYVVGILSVFHANELRNESVMEPRVKVNTNTNNVLLYVQNNLGYGSTALAAYPDKFVITMCGNHNNFHAVTNTYAPPNNSTSATLIIPVYLGSLLGIQNINFSITMSSTTVTEFPYSASSSYPNNKIEWEIYKLTGWPADTFDGNQSTETGMAVRSTYTFSGNISNNTVYTMTSTGSIRYKYCVVYGDGLIPVSISTSTMSKTTAVTICP